MKKRWAFILQVSIFLVCYSISHAQQPGISDSLVKILADMPDDTVKVYKYSSVIQLAAKDTSIDPEQWMREGVKLAQKLGDKKGEADIYNNLGSTYRKRSNSKKALEYYNKSLEINTAINDKYGMGVNNNNLGNLFNNEGKYLTALTYFLTSIRCFEEIGNRQKAATVNMSVGNIYADQKMPEKALPYYKSALKGYQDLKDSTGIISILVNLGALYYDNHDYNNALPAFRQALNLSEAAGFQRGVFVSLNNISQILYNQEKFDECLTYQQRSLELRRQDGDKIDIAYSLSQIGNTYLKLNQTQKALDAFNEALPMAEEMNSYENLASVYDGLASAYEISGDHHKANKYLKLFIQFKDSLYNENTLNQIAEMEARYQNEKKDLEIGKKDLELKNTSLELSKKNTQLIVLTLGILALIGFGYLFYNRYKLRQKAILDAELLKQQDLRNKAIIEAEEKERIRIAKDLHDGVGQQLSAVKMHLSALESEFKPVMSKEQEKLAALIQLVDETVKEVRSVSHNMMPNALLKSGIAAAFREFVNKISSSGALKTDLQIIGLDGRLESTTEAVLYRVLQECVSNIVKHAEASRISIQLVRHDHYLSMMIEDNGKGFDSSRVNEFNGIGLKNILSRVRFLNGEVEFDSYPGKGTTVSIQVPV